MPEWIGKTIGKVRIERYLARGGMAEVYFGTHLSLDRPVAVKLLHSYIEQDPTLMARFQREAKVVAGLRHPNIVQIFDFDTVEGHPYIVMEYLKGPTLATYLRGLHSRNERIPTHQVARLLKVLTAALDYAHGQGVIHRDIKPGNIMLHGRADEIPLDKPLTNDVEAILTDFGLVRIENAASQTASGMVSGTPAYMSPEQARGDKADHRTDIYSLGVVLYEMLAGRVPFESDSTLAVIYKHINEPPPAIAGISPAVQAVMDRALAKNPNDRYQSSREMAVDFFLAIGMNSEAETILQAAPVPGREIPKKKTATRRGPAWIGVAVVVLFCVFAVVAGSFLMASNLSVFSKGKETSDVGGTDPVDPPTQETVNLPSAEGMVQIAAGSYEVGVLSPVDEWHVQPISLTLADFWLDKYQTTNAQYQLFLDQTGGQTPEVWPDEADQPVRGVTWDQAAAYCSWIGKRMPTEAEWEAAGRGPGANAQVYPWGMILLQAEKRLIFPTRIHTRSAHCLSMRVYLGCSIWLEMYGNGLGNLMFLCQPGITYCAVGVLDCRRIWLIG